MIDPFSQMKREYNTISDDADSVIFKLITVTCVKERIMGREKIGKGGGGPDSNSVYSHFYTNP